MSPDYQKDSEPEEVACQLPGVVSQITSQVRRSSRVNVIVDGQYCFACRASVLADAGIRTGDTVTAAIRDHVLREDAFQSAYENAIELLAFRARTEREIRDRLRRRDYEPDAIERVIQRLEENRYLDDADFARFWIENRTANRPRGERALRQELFVKGVETSIIDEALADADLDQRSMAREAARKRVGSLADLPADVQRRRLTGFLQRRGFGWDVIGPVLQEILSENSESEETQNP